MPNKIDISDLLAPSQKEALAQQNRLAADLYRPGQTIEEMRVAYEQERKWWNEGGPKVPSENILVPTRHGNVSCRLYRGGLSAEPAPVIFFIHGGGFALGSVDTHDRITRVLAQEAEANVVSIDYTLAPEAKYPQAIEETIDVIKYVRERGQEMHVDALEIAFAGDSGGANMSMGTFLKMKAEGCSAPVRAMLLIYGWFGLHDSRSIRRLGGPWDGLTESDFQMYKNLYLSQPEDEFAPFVDILSQDLKDVPPAFILAAGLDPLKDDSRTLADIYRSYGIEHDFVEIPGVIHGFIHHGRLIDEVGKCLKRAAVFFKSQSK
ncbi:acetyl esterase [Arcanobacterium buesumense]|uniref:Acetyl esterase n=1 Tax=Arcanobacterium buesumense TaxID=2722751 RepID=A0A6H2EMI9_9ACTO|nr:acetyl esterase [Arcanobacterium buesumense]QJC22289.1 acetyl esterase [Arcanobacterium buesumense]